jgi:hypothetical protein
LNRALEGGQQALPRGKAHDAEQLLDRQDCVERFTVRWHTIWMEILVRR